MQRTTVGYFADITGYLFFVSSNSDLPNNLIELVLLPPDFTDSQGRLAHRRQTQSCSFYSALLPSSRSSHPDPLLPSKGYSWSHTTQAAFPKVTESQRCLTTYLTSLDDQRPMLMAWGIHSGIYPIKNLCISWCSPLENPKSPVTTMVRVYMAERKDQTGVQVQLSHVLAV